MAFTYRDYEESDALRKAREAADAHSVYNASDAVNLAQQNYQNHMANKISPWDGGKYGTAVQNAMDKINNREKFTYDLNGDALYQQYKNQYMGLGKLAMADTMGQAAQLTGGYGNSYASTAGNQAYQSYLTKLNDVVPQLYGMALDQYNAEGADLYNQLGMYRDAYNTEYGEYRDRLGDWNTEANRLYGVYNDERSFDYGRFSDDRNYYTTAYNNERNYDYNMYTDAYNRAFQNYQQSVAEDQWNREFALKQAEFEAQQAARAAASSGGGSGSAEYKESDKVISDLAWQWYQAMPNMKSPTDADLEAFMDSYGLTTSEKNALRSQLKALGANDISYERETPKKKTTTSTTTTAKKTTPYLNNNSLAGIGTLLR